MDRSISHPDQGGRRRRAGARLTIAFALSAFVALIGGGFLASSGAQAQSAVPPKPSAPAAPAPSSQEAAAKNPDKLYVDADQLVYDNDHNIVTATGAVVLYYKNRVLQADKVVYDRNAKRVLAEGRAKLTDEHGNTTYAPRFDLTEDFASGFADSVQQMATNKTRFTASRVERSAGTVTVLETGAYTACEPCKAHPNLPAEWQVRAAKIIENQETHTVYFENAWLDLFGVPVVYMPYMSAPDPTVTRQSGVLAPAYTSNTTLGIGVSVPYFFNLAPNYDLTLTPTYYTRQGPALDAVWRQRLDNGEYSVTLSGVDQQQPNAFASPPYDAGNLKFRGSAQSEGKFLINDKWTVGWDVTLLTDRYYLNDYKLITIDPAQFFFQDVVSSVYLRGQGDRSFFDLSGYTFQATNAAVRQGVAAVAYGTTTVPKCLKIVGPGSPWVLAAKSLLAQEIDPGHPRGAERVHHPRRWRRQWGIGRARPPHRSGAWCRFIGVPGDRQRARGRRGAGGAAGHWRRMQPKRRGYAEAVLGGAAGGIVLTRDFSAAVEFVNQFAPEHLEILAAEPMAVLGRIRNAGEVLLGNHTPITLGNYLLGPNTVLPTGGGARTTRPCPCSTS